jgi:hypothetical protein
MHTSNKQSEKEIQKTTPFIVASPPPPKNKIFKEKLNQKDEDI